MCHLLFAGRRHGGVPAKRAAAARGRNRRQRRLRRRHRSQFDDALLRAANDLFSKANLPAGSAKIELVVDPLIDGISGANRPPPD